MADNKSLDQSLRILPVSIQRIPNRRGTAWLIRRRWSTRSWSYERIFLVKSAILLSRRKEYDDKVNRELITASPWTR